MVGYASDEDERLHRLTKKTQSILWTMGITEKECFKICDDYGLLSPLYKIGFNRDGCWFCPNQTKFEREYIVKNYPNLYAEIEWLISITDMENIWEGTRNNWIQDYYKEHIAQKDQISIWDNEGAGNEWTR